MDKFLYSGNSPILAFSSCVGSVVSMAISFTALISAGYTFGWHILFSLTAGSLSGLAAILTLLKDGRLARIQPTVDGDEHRDGASYLVVFQRGRSTFPAFFVLFLVFYSCMLTTELGVLRVFLAALFRLPTPELFIIVSMIAIVCYSYVFIGGFRAVLITDYFQLLVIITFIGLLLANANLAAISNIPTPTAAKVHWTIPTLVVLHLGVYIGAFAWTFANLDQWYRTAGTLPLKAARTILIQAVIVLCVFTVVPVFAGSLALNRPGVPQAITNEISLFLVQALLRSGNSTLRFTFVMALVCAALTTLNTYIMTIQQVYYEMSIRLHARTHRWYIVEYLTKWRQVRAVGLLFTATCFLASFLVSAHFVYAFGVFALSGFVFSVPFLLSEAFSDSGRKLFWLRISTRATHGLVVSLLLFMPLVAMLRSKAGDVSLHLYVIPAAAGLAALIGNVPLLLLSPRQEVSSGQ